MLATTLSAAQVIDLARDLLAAGLSHARGLKPWQELAGGLELADGTLGWGEAPNDTIRLARLAQETGLIPVYEARHGEITAVSKIRRRVPVEEYLKPQKRFAHLFKPKRDEEVLAALQAMADRNIVRYNLLDDEED